MFNKRRLSDQTENAYKYIVRGEYDYPATMKGLLRQYGNNQVRQIIINRQPLSTFTNWLLQLGSGGEFFDKLRSSPYDKLFHLRSILILDNGKRIQFDKTQSVRMVLFSGDMNARGAESVEVSNVPSLTLGQIVENTRQSMGDKRFFTYSASNNNCQDFLTAMLNANISNASTYTNFVKQNTEFVFKNNSFFRKLAHSATDLGRATDYITGNGIIKVNVNKPTSNYELEELCKKLGIKLNGVYMKDELPQPIPDGNYIMNLENMNQGGSHWTCFIKKGSIIYYVDSFGVYPPQTLVDIADKYRNNIQYNSGAFQELKSQACGYFCVGLFLYVKQHKGSLKKKIDSYLELFNYKKPKVNDKFIKNMIEKNLL